MLLEAELLSDEQKYLERATSKLSNYEPKKKNRRYITINEIMRRQIDGTKEIVRKEASAGCMHSSNADF